MAVLSRSEGDLWYEVRPNPSGRRLLVVNGSGSSLSDIALLLDHFSSRFHVVSFDHRGFGRSNPSRSAYSMADVAHDASSVISAVGWSSCGVLGVSYGGMVAQHLAVKYPRSVERLVLACTSSGGSGGSSFPLHELADLPEGERSAILPRLIDTRFTPEWLALHSDQALLAATRPAPSSPVERMSATMQFAARRAHDAWEELVSIACPTLVASGTFDAIAPPENGRRLASRISGAEFREYDGGHPFFVQDRRALSDMMDFLEGAGEWAKS